MADRRELLGPGLYICVDDTHTFGADALFLADFARLREGDSVFDLCAGCGAVGARLFGRCFPPKQLTAVEIDANAARLCSLTAQSPAMEGRMRVHSGDLRELGGVFPQGCADLVVANPPYFETGRGKRPPDDTRLAARSDITCTLDDLCRAAAHLLRPGGRLTVCQRPEHILPLCDAMRRAGIEPKRLCTVAHSPQNKPFLLLCEGAKGGRPGLVYEAAQYVKNNP